MLLWNGQLSGCCERNEELPAPYFVLPLKLTLQKPCATGCPVFDSSALAVHPGSHMLILACSLSLHLSWGAQKTRMMQ
jgi:hypothetical protein